jgi:hypothetical protein
MQCPKKEGENVSPTNFDKSVDSSTVNPYLPMKH